jgi:hypothetical protein
MEAHAGRIRVPTPTRAKPRLRARLLELVRELSRAQRDRAIRAHQGARVPYVPGSEHTHMLRPRGF